MKKMILLVLAAMLIVPTIRAEENSKEKYAWAEDGILDNSNQAVLDQETAIEIAYVYWEPVYGKDLVEKGKPYRAVLEGDEWSVFSSANPNMRGGGTPEAIISKKDGRILKAYISR